MTSHPYTKRSFPERVYLVIQAAEPVRAVEIKAVLRASSRQVERALQTLRRGGWARYERGPHRTNEGHWSCVYGAVNYLGGHLEINLGITSGHRVSRTIITEADLMDISH